MHGKLALAMATCLGAEEYGWTLVKGRSEQSERLEDDTNLKEIGPKSFDFQQKMDYRALVGAPIKRVIRSSAETGRAYTERVKEKIGGGLYQASPRSEPPLDSRQDHSVDLDMCNPGEWPRMGMQRTSEPQLGSWSTVLKNPAPVIKQDKNQVRIVKSGCVILGLCTTSHHGNSSHNY